MGIACAILIILFVKDELTFDNFHSQASNIYRTFYTAERRDGSMVTNTVTPMVIGATMKQNYPEVEATTIWISFQAEIEYEEKSFSEEINIASPGFFQIFDFKPVEGSLESALSNSSKIVLTESMARKYFGNESAIDKTLLIPVGPGKKAFIVSAVIEDVPSNSSLQFTSLVHEENAKDIFPPQMITSWNMIAAESYVLLSDGADAKSLERKFPDMVKTAIGEQLEGRKFDVGLQQLKDIHLNTSMPQGIAQLSNPKYTLILSAIALLILVMACVNFVNLSLGRSFARSREIGIKKVVGAMRFQLVGQFLGEAIWLAIISLVIGLVVSYWMLPIFNELSGKNLEFDFSALNLVMFAGLAIGVGVIAGIYPAIVISGFVPSKILRGSLGIGSGKQGARKGMLVVQLVLSIFLITSTIFMKRQLQFLQNKNLGYNKDQVIMIPLTVPDARGLQETITKGFDKSERITASLRDLPQVEEVAVSTQSFGDAGWMKLSYNDQDQTQHNFFVNIVDVNFIPLMQMEITEGRNFISENESDNRRSIIVNETFVNEFNLENPIGKRIPNERFADHEIIGVVKDFNFSSLHTTIEPLVLTMNSAIVMSGATGVNVNSSFNPKIALRIRAGEIGDGLIAVQSRWKEIYPDDPFNYSFIDEAIKEQYQQEGNLGQIVTSATILSIVIGSLGLFGLSALTMTARMKEISIRKVLGATLGNLIFSLGRSYLILTLASTLIAAPITIYFISNWLKTFEYKIGLEPYIFIAGGSIAILICLFTIAYQAIKIALSNPIGNLRTE